MIISGMPGDMLTTFEYLSHLSNVMIALDPEEIAKELKLLAAKKRIGDAKVAVFTSDFYLEDSPWLNYLLKGKLRAEYIGARELGMRYKSIAPKEACGLAEEWTSTATVMEPTLEDITKSAKLYLAMKGMVEERKCNYASVIGCASIAKTGKIDTQFCFAVAKLCDEGVPTECWTGDAILPVIFLHTLSEKTPFICDLRLTEGNTITFTHCAVSLEVASAPVPYTLRDWHGQRGKVTGYCQMPKGEVTISSCSMDMEKMLVTKGKITDCKDLGGDNCRVSLWVEVEDVKRFIHNALSSEYAVVYGDCVEDVKQLGKMVGIEIIEV